MHYRYQSNREQAMYYQRQARLAHGMYLEDLREEMPLSVLAHDQMMREHFSRLAMHHLMKELGS